MTQHTTNLDVSAGFVSDFHDEVTWLSFVGRVDKHV